MENLEKTLEKVEPRKDETFVRKPLYNGLRLIEEKKYSSGTSIKYWM